MSQMCGLPTGTTCTSLWMIFACLRSIDQPLDDFCVFKKHCAKVLASIFVLQIGHKLPKVVIIDQPRGPFVFANIINC